jgi:hypothetical protein
MNGILPALRDRLLLKKSNIKPARQMRGYVRYCLPSNVTFSCFALKIISVEQKSHMATVVSYAHEITFFSMDVTRYSMTHHLKPHMVELSRKDTLTLSWKNRHVSQWRFYRLGFHRL